MERVVRGRSFTLTKTFYADGVAADPTGSPTVTVTRADGTAVTTGAVTDETAQGTWSVTIPATSNTLLDTYTVDWAATVNGVSQEYLDTVEVAGGVLFTIAEFRTVLPDSKASAAITTAQIVAARTFAEQSLEDACGVAFVPRYYEETVSGTGGTDVMLRWARVRAFRSVSIDGADVTPLSSVVALREGLGYLSTNWTLGRGNVIVAYEHGWDNPPERVRRAALLLAKQWVLNSPIDDRATSMSNDDGTFALMTPGLRGSVFGIPEVEATIQQYNLNVGVA